MSFSVEICIFCGVEIVEIQHLCDFCKREREIEQRERERERREREMTFMLIY